MHSAQYMYQPDKGWRCTSGSVENPELLLAFGSGNDCGGDVLVEWWQNTFPEAELVGCSTAGEICDTSVLSNTIVVTALEFEHSRTQIADISFETPICSRSLGKDLASKLPLYDLKMCLVLSEGLNVNGSQLVDGLNEILPAGTIVTGGLAGDGKRFQQTQVCRNQHYGPNKAVVIGFYGDNLEVGYGSLGGWAPFGPDRLITRADANVLHELDDRNALDLYKEYLGEYACDLPSSGLLFPLKVTTKSGHEVVRTLLATDENNGTLTFAGDLPEGAYAQFMRANSDGLIDGALNAAEQALSTISQAPTLAILISCVGRRMVLEQRVEEELEAIRDVFGPGTLLSGYYSYGEICPQQGQTLSTLHNQTMTITTIREVNGR